MSHTSYPLGIESADAARGLAIGRRLHSELFS